MKKKLLALALAVCLIVCMAVPVLATDTSSNKELTDTTKTGTTTVKYEQSQSYKVTIPSEITLNAYGGEAVELAVNASDVSLESGKKLQVTVSSGNGWKIQDNTSKYSYGYKLTTSSAPNTALTDNAVVLTVNAGTLTGSATLNASLTEAVAVAASYTDTLTFTVSVS